MNFLIGYSIQCGQPCNHKHISDKMDLVGFISIFVRYVTTIIKEKENINLRMEEWEGLKRVNIGGAGGGKEKGEVM